MEEPEPESVSMSMLMDGESDETAKTPRKALITLMKKEIRGRLGWIPDPNAVLGCRRIFRTLPRVLSECYRWSGVHKTPHLNDETSFGQ